MNYCARCVYPENARPTILFDDEGVCSGCRVAESKGKGIDWDERKVMLDEIIAHYKEEARRRKNPYDCIIPVSGGKDSHYQVYLAREVYGLNPLLVVYNHCFNTPLGVRNLRNMIKHWGCDTIRFTHGLESVRKITRHMLKTVGDVTWHYHTGIYTFPFQIAVKYEIPLVLWGEHGYSEVTGMFRLEDIPEFTKWCRTEHEMRGIEVDQIVNEETGITWQDVAPLVFPDDEAIERVGVRGIYLGNYVPWKATEQARFLHDKYGFKFMDSKRERTFSLYHKIDDHANDVHDYLKYLKFGYGRGSDLAAHEIRAGRMTREEGIEMVREYDHVRPSTLDGYLEFLGMTEEEFEASIEHMRDPSIWERDAGGKWRVKDCVTNHVHQANVEAARLPLVSEKDRTFGELNRSLYYGPGHVPSEVDDTYVGGRPQDGFMIL